MPGIESRYEDLKREVLPRVAQQLQDSPEELRAVGMEINQIKELLGVVHSNMKALEVRLSPALCPPPDPGESSAASKVGNSDMHRDLIEIYEGIQAIDHWLAQMYRRLEF
jgi:hypothetical protein